MKLYYLMIISVLFSSCSVIISDEDGDGISNGSRFVTKVYSDRESLEFHSYIRALMLSATTSGEIWFTGDSPLESESGFLNPKRIKKGNVVYKWKESSVNKNFSIYEILDSLGTTGTGKFVVMVLEALPIFDEDPAVLLISAGTPFDSINAARAYGVANEIPKLSITVPFLDLVFDPDTLVIGDNNMVEHLTAITTKYTLLEIFGRKSVEEKKYLLQTYKADYDVDYSVLFTP